MKHRIIRSITSFILAMICCLMSSVTIYADGLSSLSLEQVFSIYGELPAWLTLLDDSQLDVDVLSSSEESVEMAKRKETADILLNAFKHSSDYMDFKTKFDECAKFDADIREIVPLDDTPKTISRCSSLMKQFSLKVSQGELNRIVGQVNLTDANNSKAGKLLDVLNNKYALFVYILGRALIKAAITTFCLRCLMDCIAITIEQTQSFLFKKRNIRLSRLFHRAKAKRLGAIGIDSEEGLDEGVPFTICSKQCINAVKSQIQIESSGEGIEQSNIFISYLKDIFKIFIIFILVAYAFITQKVDDMFISILSTVLNWFY